MRIEWAGSGPELLVRIDRGSGTGLRTQLEEQLRAAIRSGRLAVDEPLPASPELGPTRAPYPRLVQDCYTQLQAEGYLTSRPGSATRVAAAAANSAGPRPPAVVAAEARYPVADFRHGVPDLALAPREAWAWAMREACRTAENAAFDYGEATGRLRLREVLASYLSRVRAVDAGPGDVIISAGMQQALALVIDALATEGITTVAFEDPGSGASLTQLATAAGLRAVPVPVDEAGLDVAALEATGAGAVLVTPAHQWPTGVVLTGPRRQELIAWARRRRGFIIEDDYDAEFRYDRDPVGSLQGLAPDRVVSLGTVSKSLAPALRLGWMIVPPGLLTAVADGKYRADRGSPGLDQIALATLIESGRYDRHLRRMRSEYAARRETLVTSLGRRLPRLSVTGLAAGFHAVLHLPEDRTESEVIEAAAARGVGLYGMAGMHHLTTAPPPRLILGFGTTPPRSIQAGIDVLADLLS